MKMKKVTGNLRILENVTIYERTSVCVCAYKYNITKQKKWIIT